MLTLIIIATIALAMISIVGINILTLGSQTEQLLSSVEERANIAAAKNLLQQSMRPLGKDRTLIVPMGSESINGYTTLPSSISVSKSNSWGIEYLYCPFSLNQLTGAGDGSVVSPNYSSYEVEITTDSDGNNYVYSSTLPPVNKSIVAALISPIPSSTMPNCSDIRYDEIKGDFYLVGYNGIIEVIRKETSYISRQSEVVDLTPSSGLLINEELSFWDSYTPEMMTVNLTAGSYNTGNITFINPSKARNKEVIFNGSGVNSSFLSPSSAIITFENMVVRISDISFDNTTTLRLLNSELYVENSKISNLESTNSQIHISGNSTLNSASQINLVDSKLTSKGTSLLIEKRTGTGINLVRSSMSIDSATINNNVAGGIGILVNPTSSVMITNSLTATGSGFTSVLSVDSNGTLSMRNTSLLIEPYSDTAIYSKGFVDIDSSNIIMSNNIANGIVLDVGSVISFQDSVIGSSAFFPSVGINDLNGARFIGGSGSAINADSNCWQGDVFYTTSSLDGSSSQTSDVGARMYNKSSWQCNIR